MRHKRRKKEKKPIRIPESFLHLLAGELCIILLNLVCYEDWIWMIPLQGFMVPFMIVSGKYSRKKRKRIYQMGFKELLVSLMTSMQAGYSFENSCVVAYEELSGLYGENHLMVMEVKKIVQGIELHIPTDELFMRFARTTGVNDAYQLAVLLSISNKVGTNLVVILREAMESMQDKMATTEEIDVLLSGKIFEKNIMLLMPFGILLYMQLTNPGYLDFFYTSLAGHLLMTVILFVVLFCFFWTEKIMNIEP